MAEVPIDQPVPGACEYHVEDVPVKISPQEAIALLNPLGAQGWQAIQVTNITTDDPVVRVWFKREL